MWCNFNIGNASALALLGFLLNCQAYKFTAGVTDMALIKLEPICSCYFKAPPVPIYCIPRVKGNNKELVFKQHVRALLRSFEA